MGLFLRYALWTDLRRGSTWALALSSLVIAVSIALCGVLFAVAGAVREAVEAELVDSGATTMMEVAARPDKDFQKPWTAPPIGTDQPAAALNRLVEALRGDYGDDVLTAVEPAWLSPGWVYLFLTPPDQGGVPVSVGISLTSPADPERERVKTEQLAGDWVTDPVTPQIVLPQKIADRLWQDVLFVGEPAWVGITETSTCAQVTVAGIYQRTQRNYAFANAPVAAAIQAALDAKREDRVAAAAPNPDLQHDRLRLYFKNRRTLMKARRDVEERFKFWAATPYDKFESKLRLAATAQISAWTVFAVTLGSAGGAILCTFLSWVSRRRYEIALLKAQGATQGWVAGLYVVQSAAAGLLAGMAGAATARATCPWLSAAVADRLGADTAWALHLPGSAQAALVAAAVALTVVAALIPARLAARQAPWDILREAA